jgi:hypothetical protein
LLHELAHIKRGDVAFQLLGRAACAINWFQPLAWWGLYQLRVEREHACDDVVVAAGERASDYAEQLLAVARICRRPSGLALAVEITRGTSLERRVRVLLDAARSHVPLSRRWAVALLVAMLVVAGSAAVLRPVKRQEGWTGLVKGPLEQRVRVTDAKGQPVRGAKLIDLGFGTTPGSGYAWPKAWPRDFGTDADGKVVISVPDVTGFPQDGGIVRLDFSVTHPNHPIKRVTDGLSENEYLVTLEDPLKVRIRASRAGGGGPVTADLLLQGSGRTGPKWALVDGILQSDTLSPTDPEGGRYLRVIHAPAAQPMWFGDLIDLKQHVAGGGTGKLNLTLHPGVRVEGKVADDVPRPIDKGIVCASIDEGVDSPQWNSPQLNWVDATKLQADGTFIFASLPRETNLQLIAVCDGWTSRSPTAAEIDEYRQKHRFKGPSEFPEGPASVAARVYRLTGAVVKPVLPMQQTTSCEVTVIDPVGNPIEGVHVRFAPITIWSHGTTILGNEWSSLEKLQNKGAAEVDWWIQWEKMFKPFTTRTDSNGKGIMRGLIPGRTKVGVEFKGYEVVPGPNSAATKSILFHEPQVELKAGETARATVTMRRKE